VTSQANARLECSSCKVILYIAIFERSGNLADLDTAVNLAEQMILSLAGEEIAKPKVMSMLSGLLLTRYALRSSLEDINRAIYLQKQVIGPENMRRNLPEKYIRLQDMATCLEEDL
jgi:hypothetical protein